MARQVVEVPYLSEVYQAWGIVPAVKSGDLMFVGGQIGIDRDGTPVTSASAQIEQAFANLELVLDAADATFDDVIDLTAFYTNYAAHGGLVRPIREKFFGDALLCNWTAVGVSELADPFVFELKAVVRLPS